MSFVQLTGGSYESRSILASAQRCLNLYLESTPQNQGEPLNYIAYPTPGKTLLKAAPNAIIRCLYRATTGNLYGCAGSQVYYIDRNWQWNLLGTMAGSALSDVQPRTTPVSMTDNQLVLLMCDGSVDGWFVDITQPLGSQTLQRIDRNINTGWLGSDRVDYQDTYFLANSPGTSIFYCSLSVPNAQLFLSEFSIISSTVVAGGSGYVVGDVLTLTGTGDAQTTVLTTDTAGAVLTANVTAIGGIAVQPANPVPTTMGLGTGATFDLQYTQGTGAWNPLDFAAKSGMADNLVSVVSVHRVLWLIGESSYEIWTDSGGGGSGALASNTFPFEIIPALFGNIGCIAKYSIATATVNVLFWLSQDASGKCIVLKGSGEAVSRISTHAIETQISSYPVVSDAIGFAYQQEGHVFYQLNFPSAPNMQNKAFAGASWIFDATSELWHERAWIDDNGIEYRDRANCAANAYNTNVCGDWENSNFYEYDLSNYTDAGQPVVRIRDFPHQIDTQANRRVFYSQLIANMQCGEQPSLSSPTETVIDASFVAPNATLLQNYHNNNDVGATFTQGTSTVNMVIASDLVVGAAAGNAVYSASGTPNTPDYAISFNVGLANYSTLPDAGSDIYAIGRAVSATAGYAAVVISDGTTMSIGLSILPASAPSTVAIATAGQLTAHFTVTLTMQGSSITVAVQRSQDGNWLMANGSWAGGPTNVFAIEDSTYILAGEVFIGGVFT